ncbi:MAG: hypothetical protein ACJ79R_23020 [Anaeromyxobacteraceae bacterium]
MPNIVAMFASIAAMASLSHFAARMSGGQFAAVAKLVALGVFLSVFVHAGVELAEMFGLIDAQVLMVLMSFLLSAGSASFCAAGILGVKALR